jgi:hypothetical protein
MKMISLSTMISSKGNDYEVGVEHDEQCWKSSLGER